MKLKATLLYTATTLLANHTFITAQNVGINTSGASPDASAMLDIASANKGLLIPRVPLTATNAASPIVSPTTSLLVYNTATASSGTTAVVPGYYYWDGTAWISLSGGSGGKDWALLGNNGTNSSTNFIGTIDAQDVVIRTTNTERLRVLATGNVGIGNNSPSSAKLMVNSTATGTDGITGTHTSASTTTNFHAIKGDVSNVAYTQATGFVGYHTGGNVTYGIFGALGNYAGVFTGKTYIGNTQPNTAIHVADLEISNTTAGAANQATVTLRQSTSLTTTNDNLGVVNFSDNTIVTPQASMQASRDAAGGVADYPTRLTFSTTADGASSQTERLRITNAGLVGINTTAPSNTLDVNGTTRIRTMITGALTDALVTANGTGVLTQTTAANFTNANAWGLLGNSLTTAGTNFIGTTDNQHVVFKRQNTWAGFISTTSVSLGVSSMGLSNTGTSNTAIGYRSMEANVGGFSNTALGAFTLLVNTSGFLNIAIGAQCLKANNGNNNIGVGFNALTSNLIGQNNVAVGSSALGSSTASYNVALGANALQQTITGSTNTAIGSSALFNNISGYSNTAVGSYAGLNITHTAGAYPNTIIGAEALTGGDAVTPTNNTANTNVVGGYQAMYGTTGIASTGVSNVSQGVQSMFKNTSGSYNSVIGNNAFFNNTAGNYNVALGSNAGYRIPNSNYNILIGSGSMSSGDIITPANNTAFNNVAIGHVAMAGTAGIPLTANNNVAIGFQVMRNISTGLFNVALGSEALNGNTTGNYNVVNGSQSLYSNISGSYNTVVGNYAGPTNTIGSYNLLLGAATDFTANNLSRAVAIGYNAKVGGSNMMALGGTGADAVNVGIGVTTPTNTLDINGTTRVRSMAGSALTDVIVTADATGVLTQQTKASFTNANAWGLLGNSLTTAGTNFIGTTDNVDVVFKRNNVRSGILNAVGRNTAFGVNALNAAAINTGTDNTAVGANTGTAMQTGGANTCMGTASLYTNTIGNNNTTMGVHGLYSNLDGGQNTAIGVYAQDANTSGSENTSLGYIALWKNTTASGNTAIGSRTMYNNVTGANNTAMGYQSMNNNNVDGNTAVGYQALYTNNGGTGNVATGYQASYSMNANYNTSNGYQALYSHSGGASNTAMGYKALYSGVGSNGNWNTAVGANSLEANTANANTGLGEATLNKNSSGGNNTAAGAGALRNSINGNFNCAFGTGTLGSNISGTSNTAYGIQSLQTNTIGDANTGLGALADVGANNLSNATAIGNGATVNTSNKVRIGNSSVTVVEGPVSYTFSDGRFKNNVTEEVQGLKFINKLRPVVYNLDTRKMDEFLMQNMSDSIKTIRIKNQNYAPSTAIRQSGFIAQEVEKAAKECNYDFNGVHVPENKNDNYSVSYQTIVVPLVKAVQELNKTTTSEVDALKLQLQNMQQQLDEFKQQITQLKK
jgi:trimeric autotransporter adhesin